MSFSFGAAGGSLGNGCEDGGDDGVFRDQAALAFGTAGQGAAFLRADDAVTAGGEGADILLRGGMLPHLAVHGGEDEDGGAVGEVEARQRVGRHAVRHAGDGVGRGGHDGEHIRLLREVDVHGHPSVCLILETADHGVAGERHERERGDEVQRRRGADAVHLVPQLHETRRNPRRLVRGDGTRDAENDAGHGEKAEFRNLKEILALRRVELHNHVDFHGDAEGQRDDTHGGAGVRGGRPEELDQQVGRAVDDLRLVGEIGGAVHKAVDSHNFGDGGKTAQLTLNDGKAVEDGAGGGLLTVFDAHILAELSIVGVLSVDGDTAREVQVVARADALDVGAHGFGRGEELQAFGFKNSGVKFHKMKCGVIYPQHTRLRRIWQGAITAGATKNAPPHAPPYDCSSNFSLAPRLSMASTSSKRFIFLTSS